MIDVELTQDDVQNIVNAYDKDIKKMKQQEKEIDRLNKSLDETRLSELHKEYIINELEKYFDGKDVYKMLLIKLKALKENNNV